MPLPSQRAMLPSWKKLPTSTNNIVTLNKIDCRKETRCQRVSFVLSTDHASAKTRDKTVLSWVNQIKMISLLI